MAQKKKESEIRQIKYRGKIDSHRHKQKCEDVTSMPPIVYFIDRMDNIMLDVDKDQHLELVQRLDFVVDQCSEGAHDIIYLCKHNTHVFNSLKGLVAWFREIYDKIKSHHLQYKIVADDKIKCMAQEVQEMKKTIEIQDYSSKKKQNSLPFKELEKSLKEFIQQKQGPKSRLPESKFSGVDNDLEKLGEYWEFIGRNRTDIKFLLPQSINFAEFQEYVKVRAKNIQISSSKIVASRLSKEPPKMVWMGVQADAPSLEETDADKLELDIFRLNMTNEAKSNQVDKLWEDAKRLKLSML